MSFTRAFNPTKRKGARPKRGGPGAHVKLPGDPRSKAERAQSALAKARADLIRAGAIDPAIQEDRAPLTR